MTKFKLDDIIVHRERGNLNIVLKVHKITYTNYFVKVYKGLKFHSVQNISKRDLEYAYKKVTKLQLSLICLAE